MAKLKILPVLPMPSLPGHLFGHQLLSGARS